MKFTVEVDEFWLDEESELAPALRNIIKHDVVNQISNNIKDNVQKEITEKVTVFINDVISSAINEKISEIMATGVIKQRNGTEISITDHVTAMFNNNSGWNSVSNHIDKFAKSFADELKRQYNAAFANKVVLGMKEQGLLKDEVVNILLGGDKK